MERFEVALKSAIVAGVFGLGIIGSQYQDVVFGSKNEAGRTKNSLAAVVGGIVAQKMYGSSTVDLQVQKTMWPDTKVTGYTTSSNIDTYVPVTFSSSHFTAATQNDNLTGNVSKSEFDWKVTQTSTDMYHIKRFGPKFDCDLQLHLADGKITGKYIRSGPHFDWDINGTYSQNGHVNITIDGPVSMGITLEGTVKKN